MLFLRTGLPGAGKTLNTIKELDEEHAADPANPNLRLHKDPDDSTLPPRTIYYHGIPDLKVDKLKSKWVEWDKPEEWFNLPDGSVIVIDEAQGTFGTDVRTRVEKVTRFEKHRHHGWDVHIITQHPSLICSPVRKLVGNHINFIRPYGRTKGVFRHQYEMCIDSPERRANFKMAQESKIEFDSHYFGLYKSSTVHTHKKVTPSYYKLIVLSLIFLLVLVLAFVGVTYYFIKKKSAESEAIAAEAHVLPGQTKPELQQSRTVAPAASKSEPDQYIEQLKPRIADVPASAPRYDETNKARDFPRPTCMSSTDVRMLLRAQSRGQKVGVHRGEETVCQCYTQQSTRMATSFEFCMSVVENGYFDDTRQMPAYAQSQGGLSSRKEEPADGLRRGPAAVDQKPVDTSSIKGAKFTVVSDTSRGGRNVLQ